MSRLLTIDTPTLKAKLTVTLVQITYMVLFVWFGSLVLTGQNPIVWVFGNSLLTGLAGTLLTVVLLADNILKMGGRSLRVNTHGLWAMWFVMLMAFWLSEWTSTSCWSVVQRLTLTRSLIIVACLVLLIATVTRHKRMSKRGISVLLLPVLGGPLLFAVWVEGTTIGRARASQKAAESGRRQAHLEEAEVALRESLAVLERYRFFLSGAGIPDSWQIPYFRERAKTEVALARVHLDSGTYSDAHQWCLAAEQTSEKAGLRWLEDEALISMVEAHWRLNDVEAARLQLRRLEANASLAFNRPYRQAEYRLLEGRVAMATGDHADAAQAFTASLHLARLSGALNIAQSSLVGLGAAYEALGKLEDAVAQYDSVLKLARRKEDKRASGKAWFGKGRVYRRVGKHERSDSAIREAIRLADGAADRETRWAALCEQGLSAERQGKTNEAMELYGRAVDVIESIRGALKGEQERAHFLSAKLQPYERLALLASATGDVPAAFEHAQRAKARALLDLVGTRMLNYREEHRELGDRERELQRRTHALLRQIAEAESKSTGSDDGDMDKWRRQLARTAEEHQALLRQIQHSDPELASLVTAATATVDDLQKVLRPDEVLLEYFVTEEKTLLWAITDASLDVSEIAVSRRQLSELTDEWRSPLQNHRSPDRAVSLTLFRLLLAPALPAIEGKQHVIVSPHHVLFKLAFEALLTGTEEPSHVVDRWVLSYYSSGSLLVLQRTQEPRSVTTPRPLLAIGDPVFADPQRSGYPASGREHGPLQRNIVVTESLRQTLGDDLHTDGARIVFPRLPGAAKELRGICGIMGVPLNSPDVRTGVQATERAVKEMDHTQYRYEHYATHVIVGGDIPILKEPAIVFSFPNPDDPITDEGFWTMSEIFGMRSNADLAVIGGCKGVLGEDVPGEGLIGLTRAFMYAGTPTVVASLWEVSDESTARLMISFYRYLKAGVGKAQALTLAKRELKEDPDYESPYYWAPFILLGEP